MFPLGHAAFAYLTYVGYAALTRRLLPVHWALVPLAVGSQFPDLIDKPLSYYGVLVSGRSLGHSLLTAVVVIAAVWWLTTRLEPPADPRLRRLREVTPPAFAVGYLSHLLADALGPIAEGTYRELGFLLYPVVPPIEYPKGDLSPLARLAGLYEAPLSHPQIELIGLAGLVFVGLELRAKRQTTAPTA